MASADVSNGYLAFSGQHLFAIVKILFQLIICSWQFSSFGGMWLWRLICLSFSPITFIDLQYVIIYQAKSVKRLLLVKPAVIGSLNPKIYSHRQSTTAGLPHPADNRPTLFTVGFPDLHTLIKVSLAAYFFISIRNYKRTQKEAWKDCW